VETAVRSSRADTFVRLLAQHQRGVYALILSLVPNWADADEILQETNVRLWEQFDRYQPGTDFGAWARTVARFQVLTYRRQQGRSRVHFTSDFIDAVCDAHEQSSCDADRHEALSACLERLPERHRELLRAYYAPEADASAISARWGRSIESVRLTLFRVRRSLRECIDRRTGRQVCG
jgi:RNA polymerase sigma-70 factor (ECF subfamily)